MNLQIFLLRIRFSPLKERKKKLDPNESCAYDANICGATAAMQNRGREGRRVVIKLAEFLTQAGIKIKRHEKPLLKSAVYLRLEIVDRHRYQITRLYRAYP